MKKAFAECYRAVLACDDGNGRKRCELFRELPDKSVCSFLSTVNLLNAHSFPIVQAYPDYFTIIKEPIALSILRKRANSGYYKTVLQFRDDYRLMFNNARKYNQEGSWVYVDAEEMEKVFNAAWDRAIVGSDLPGAPPTPGTVSATGSYASALTPMDDDDRPPPPSRGRSAGRKQVLSDEEYLTPSDDE